MSKFFDFAFSLLLLCAAILVFAVGLDALIDLDAFNRPSCTNAELHQIIDKVNIHKKNNGGIYDPSYGEKLISEVCK